MKTFVLFLYFLRIFIFWDENWDWNATNGREGISKLESLKRREFTKIDTAGDNLLDA